MSFLVKKGDNIIEINSDNKVNLLEALAEYSIFINAYCGGRGTCKKCTVRYLKNAPKPTKNETYAFNESELRKGFRLACQHTAIDDTVIEIFESKISFASSSDNRCCADDSKNYIALDIGTTTVAASLIADRKVKENAFLLNPQVVFGSDVVSRIAKSNGGKRKILENVLDDALFNVIKTFKQKYSLNGIDGIVAAANPTMIAFFLKKSAKCIGEYPYKPIFTGSKTVKWHNIDVYIPYIVSAYLGSDIISGLLSADLSSNFAFVDIGTNCEVVVKYGEKIAALSVPSGPALEGLNIDFGIMAKEGAIESADFNGVFNIKTIGNKRAEGISGSGLVSLIALLNKYGLIDSTGRLLDAWESDAPLQLVNRIKKEGFLLYDKIFLTQNSVREFQLVKASLAAGIKIILNKLSLNINDIKTVYISGGFSKSLKKEDMICSDLINLDAKFIFLGNSALNGAKHLFCSDIRRKADKIAERMEYIDIVNEGNFQELYLKHMEFRKC